MKNEDKSRAKFLAKFISEVFETPSKFVCTDRTDFETVLKVVHRYINGRYGIKWIDRDVLLSALKLSGIKSKIGVNGGYGLEGEDREKLYLSKGVYLKVSPRDVWAIRALSNMGILQAITNEKKIAEVYSVSDRIKAFEAKNKQLIKEFANPIYLDHA